MISLKEYLLFEDEDNFVSIEYKTTTAPEDDVTLAGSIYDPASDAQEQVDPEDILPGGANLKLVGEIRLYSETSSVFYERKRKIASVFKTKLKDEEINANRIKFTKIFDYYITHLIEEYKKNVDKNVRLNISTKDELKRQIADDFVMLLKNMNELYPRI